MTNGVAKPAIGTRFSRPPPASAGRLSASFAFPAPHATDRSRALTSDELPPAARVASLKLLRDPRAARRWIAPSCCRFPGAAQLYRRRHGRIAYHRRARGRSPASSRRWRLCQGLRPAEPGEFALRAFENGKLDLSQVEGLADLVDAQTQAQRRQALRIAGGALTREAEAIARRFLEAMAAVEAQIDFSDQENVADLTARQARDAAAGPRPDRAQSPRRARASDCARVFNVVIAGPPNVGKSTLMNAIARRDVVDRLRRSRARRAMRSRSTWICAVYPVTLVDTAGIRETDDPIEKEGVSRARSARAEADLMLWLSERLDAPHVRRPNRPARRRRSRSGPRSILAGPATARAAACDFRQTGHGRRALA